jgi:hypothetical protein
MNVEPQKEHQWLQQLAGEWTSDADGATGTERVRSVGGLWIVAEGQGEMPGGGEMATVMTLGYDPQSRRYVGTFIGSMMTHLWLYGGTLDSAKKVLTLDTEGPSMAGDGRIAKYKDAIQLESQDHRVLTSQMLGEDGKWQPVMTVNYRRKTATKSATLAREFETKVHEAAAVLEKLSDGDWKKVTAGEQWTVGVTAHHLASAFVPVAGIVTAMVSDRPPGTLTRATLDELNARHAKDHAGCTKAETIALLTKGAATAATVVRGLSDEQLAKRATVFTDAPPMSAEQMITGALLNHIDEHVGSIRKTTGK